MKTVTIMRGVPGSGKSTKAATLGGLVLTTDDFFMENGKYVFDGKKISQAHAWNQGRCEGAMMSGVEHVIIDNTNTQAWEAKPYCLLAERFGYQVNFVTADTPWALDAEECAKRNSHGVPLESIKTMLARFEPTLTLAGCLKSKAPWER